MTSIQSLSVTETAALCGVGRTTVGYWIRSNKLFARRQGRVYRIPVADLLVFLKSTGRPIPAEIAQLNGRVPSFGSLQPCWRFRHRNDTDGHCLDCVVFRHRRGSCFTTRECAGSGSNRHCSACRYYQETYRPRIQFIHQIDFPALVFKELNIWESNSRWAEMCDMDPDHLIGLGIEKIVHAASLASVVQGAKKLMLDERRTAGSCTLYLQNSRGDRLKARISILPLAEPSGAYLAIAEKTAVVNG
jgi:excisionase family DNA binding protein